jgi:hypothetical protein
LAAWLLPIENIKKVREKMKDLFNSLVLLVSAIWAMASKEEARQYDYDCGKGEVEK